MCWVMRWQIISLILQLLLVMTTTLHSCQAMRRGQPKFAAMGNRQLLVLLGRGWTVQYYLAQEHPDFNWHEIWCLKDVHI
jgi:uncharacterized membrane protein YccC